MLFKAVSRSSGRNSLSSIKSKRSQSALEYMMTYGWAILIIVIVAVILYSMGIFNPSSSLVATVTGFNGFTVQSNCVAGGTLVLSIGNMLGYPLQINNANISLSNGSYLSEPIDYTMSISGSHNFYLQNACPTTAGSSFSDKITISGREQNSLDSPFSSTGSVSGRISTLIPYQMLENISVQGFPTSNAISPNGYYVWQPNQGPGTISIVNVVSASVIKTLDNLPARAVVFNKNGSLAFIAGNSGFAPAGSYLLVMNTSNYKIIKNISTVCEPQMLSLSPNGQILFVPDWSCGHFIAINTSSLNVIANVSTGSLRFWLAQESPNSQYIYLTATSQGIVSIMNPSTYSIIKNLTDFVNPNSVVFTSNSQYAYVGGGRYLNKIDVSSESILNNLTILNKSGVSGLTISKSDNHIYIPSCSNTGPAMTPVFDTSINSVVYNITLPKVDECISYGVLTNSNNFLYLASASGNSVFVISV
ncbi:MAG: hypothetical protein OH338_00090 [Candidatus Parvarchaeota archaeon]|nr:hypothetical protein [Candidatus Parvarchaeota archaeon]MCW1294429.1 hypothetical protein [Candidatus Parvarchaeum tengchongense]MCW1295749.1 hypothetical protein [Candidatus Parvarchaeum tengchongense]MCW1311818.1 hypothetical protein [Candidatus Parvarchaeum tengchongense]